MNNYRVMNRHAGGINMKRQKLTAIIGSMFSGKTTHLIEVYDALKNKEEHEKYETPVIFKPSLDTRYAEGYVNSHDGEKRTAIVCARADDVLTYLSTYDASSVLLDETQFFNDGIVDIIDDILESGRQVIFTALPTNFKGEPFKFPGSDRHIGELIAMADDIQQLYATCTLCGKPATKTQRLIPLEAEIMIGGTNAYEARCYEHHDPRVRL